MEQTTLFTKILRHALATFGIEAQTKMLFEEMAELQNALCKLDRGRATSEDVITEIADVMIMCRQMALHFGEDKVQEEINNKALRLADRLAHMEKGGEQ